jgi:mannose-1-phosphate guanylyltransferase
MRPLTYKIPKPLVPVLQRPFLEHQIELLETNGVKRFLLLVSYLGKAIEDRFGKGSSDIEISYSYEASPLGTGGALKNAESLLEDVFLVINGDTLLDIEYSALVGEFRSRDAMAMIAAHRNQTKTVTSNLAIDAAGIAREYEKQRPTGEYIDAGVVAVKKSVLDLIPHAQKCSFEEEVFPKLISKGQMLAWRTDRPFFDIGTPEGLETLELQLSKKQSA